jgi:hypothetical protein
MGKVKGFPLHMSPVITGAHKKLCVEQIPGFDGLEGFPRLILRITVQTFQVLVLRVLISHHPHQDETHGCQELSNLHCTAY